jgi:hypothetical protein
MPSLKGQEAWRVDDQLAPGWYIARAAKVERSSSSNQNPQVQIDWRVAVGEYQGAEQRDWITLTDPAMGRVVQVLEAAGVEIPDAEFDNYEAMADWLAKALENATVEMLIRLEPGRKDPSKEWPTIKGYRKPAEGDVPSEFGGSAPQVKDEKLPF